MHAIFIFMDRMMMSQWFAHLACSTAENLKLGNKLLTTDTWGRLWYEKPVIIITNISPSMEIKIHTLIIRKAETTATLNQAVSGSAGLCLQKGKAQRQHLLFFLQHFALCVVIFLITWILWRWRFTLLVKMLKEFQLILWN